MSRVRVDSFAISLDGFSAGPNQSLENPLGVRGPEIFESFLQTRVWRSMHELEGGGTGVDNDMAERSFAGVGAYILGRNMFGPVRGPWPDESWRGWWGEDPPYHVPTFVLTHHARKPLMTGPPKYRRSFAHPAAGRHWRLSASLHSARRSALH